VVPDAVLPGLCATSWLGSNGIRSVSAIWRAPERLSAAAQWTSLDVVLIDVAAFGETALLAARRPPGGRTLPWRAGSLTIANGGTECAYLAIAPGGTLSIHGTLAAPHYRPYDVDGFAHPSDGRQHIDTGYPCRLSADDDALIVTAPPAGLVAVGGYRFAIRDLQHVVRGVDGNAVLAALPHTLAGHRLAGHATDPVTMRDVLETMGCNPLLTAAFRDRAA
jgi:hypothetical protein